jgi:uncharacterized membrane protein YkvA (DUF1232 family)
VSKLPPADSDPFPRERFTALVRRLPRYGRLAWTLSRHPKVTSRRRMALVGAAVYLVSPIDLVPGFIPVAGQLDDAAAILIAIGVALRSMQPADRAAVLAEAGVDAADIDEDLRAIRDSYSWMARKGIRLGARATRLAARAMTGVVSGIRGRLRGRGKPGAD